ncbi:MAG: D-ribose pyranase [Eubacteriales bacterium]|nr:D-ribose pyranase [Eubacteriales bacterium]
MRKTGILNIAICEAIASLGHTEYLVIADAGLPVPKDVQVIDISLVTGIPGFREVLDAVAGEFVIDSYIYANEMDGINPELAAYVHEKLDGIPKKSVSHEELKKMLKDVRYVIRTGECTSYANVMLEGGVSF